MQAMKRGDPSTLGSKAGDSTDDSSTITEQQNPFLSKTGRQDMWKADMTAPFTKQTFNKNPAPNHYFSKKKQEDVKARLLAEETVTVPFGTRDDRPCNKPVKALNPGPGNYIDIYNPTNSSVAGKITKFEEERTLAESQGVKMGAFGSTTDRETFWCSPKDGPSPGQYDDNNDLADATAPLEVIGKIPKTRVQTAHASERRKPSSIFHSATNRFDLDFQKKDPKVRLLTSKGVPRKKFVTQTHDNKVILANQDELGVQNQITCQ